MEPTKATSKKEQALRRFEQNLQAFRCPICGETFASTEKFGIRCYHNHTFDLARNGYLNLLVGKGNSQYGKDLFSARREIFSAGVYDPLILEVASLIKGLSLQAPLVLDAGCGEGSLLARLAGIVEMARFVGIDISRDGIQLAAAQHEPVMWCVADLAKLPISNASTDVVLNVLSPANYDEFHRVLKRGGVVIKVIPGGDYLREIRLRLKGATPYSNQGVLANLEANMEILGRSFLRYEVPVTRELWRAMVEMTPLTRHREIQGYPPNHLTIDLQVVQGAFSSLHS